MAQAKQRVRETEQERKTREQEGFRVVEKGLVGRIGSRLNIPLLDNIGSYLGQKNPLAREVDPKTDAVWLFDETAYRPVHIYPHKPQPWQAEFGAAYFVKNSGKDLSRWIADIADKVGLGEEGEERAKGEATIAKRLQPLAATIRPGRFAKVNFPNGEIHKLGPGDRHAISNNILLIPGEHQDGDTIEVAGLPSQITPFGPMLTHFAAPEGWAIISDVDDTVKITMTPSPIGILRSTFVDDPTPIAGMPDLYKHIAATLRPTWFYLSASPYNLYTFLRPFLHAHYPKGTLILREASWMNLAGFLASLTAGTEAYKSGRIDIVHDWLPQRKVLCIGDSTQSDPEAYGAMCRKHPGWIKGIWIRKVTDVGEMDKTGKNSEERFATAFEGVPEGVVRIFEDPKELYEAVQALKGFETWLFGFF